MRQSYWRFVCLLSAGLLVNTASWADGVILPFEHQTRHMEQKPGAAMFDYDNDGDSDLYFVGNFPTMGVEDNPGHLFINNSDGTFAESTGKYGLWTQDESGKNTYAVGLAAGDVNDDGHVDLFV